MYIAATALSMDASQTYKEVEQHASTAPTGPLAKTTNHAGATLLTPMARQVTGLSVTIRALRLSCRRP